jgi:hypothetical protein
MTDGERLVAAIERLDRAEAVADERLTMLLILLGIGLLLGLVILGVAMIERVRRNLDHIDLVRLIGETVRHQDEMWTLLQITKGWAESARVHTKESALNLQEAKSLVPASESHILGAVEQIPDKTVLKLKEDSDPLKKAHKVENGT